MNTRPNPKFLLAAAFGLALASTPALSDSQDAAAAEASPPAAAPGIPMMGHGPMGKMHKQMQAIINTNDPAERQRLFDEHTAQMQERMKAMTARMGMPMGPGMAPGMGRGMGPRMMPRAMPTPPMASGPSGPFGMGPMTMNPGNMNPGNMNPGYMNLGNMNPGMNFGPNPGATPIRNVPLPPWMGQGNAMPDLMQPDRMMSGMGPGMNNPVQGMMSDADRIAMMNKRINRMKQQMEAMQKRMQGLSPQ